MAWFAVRSVYLFGQKSDGTNIFEERVVCFEAASAREAYPKAKQESEQYAAENNFAVFPEREAYEQDGDALIEGYELWSTLLEARLSLAEFFAERYERYTYHPE